MNEEQAEIESKIEFHARRAIALARAGNTPFQHPHIIDARAAEGDWRQVIYQIRSSLADKPSVSKFHWELDVAYEYTRLADRLGTRRAMQQLSLGEIQVLRECLLASALGPFFPEWEFQTLFGLHRRDVLRIGEAWPTLIEPLENIGKAVNNACNYLLFYPHRKWNAWRYHVSVPPWWVYEIFHQWREASGRHRTRSPSRDAAEECFRNFE